MAERNTSGIEGKMPALVILFVEKGLEIVNYFSLLFQSANTN